MSTAVKLLRRWVELVARLEETSFDPAAFDRLMDDFVALANETETFVAHGIVEASA
jgi:hypothetical protein